MNANTTKRKGDTMKETRAQVLLSRVANELPIISSLVNVGDDDAVECLDAAIATLTSIRAALVDETMEWD